ncbi:STAS domain-containing protein [Streptomyces sp. NBC_01637]|uniref:STAS domain-containing protein n=1 Tax=unclassified Streptomyces TaxID=2593676 RepID=UPI00386A36E1|nr:STAS domain-containing protein [Streptomyces sp. NBC_01653]WTD87491.1 STAS domain-containing protein [Streptomyces sp. NBC_01637]
MPVLSSLNIHRHDRGSHATITLAGELDLQTAHSVRVVIEDCLGDGIRTVDIDLALLTFCDVSGLNAFLVVSRLTTTAGGSLCLRHPSQMLTRLLDLTATGFLLYDRPLVPAARAVVADARAAGRPTSLAL